MVKKGSLIGAIITTVGAALMSLMIIPLKPEYEQEGDTTVAQFIKYSSFEYFNLLVIIRIIYVCGVLLFFLASIGTKKKSVYIGAIITLIGLIGGEFMYFIGSDDSGLFVTYLYSLEYAIPLIIQALGVLIYYGGIIKHKDFFKIGLFTGFLVVAATLANLVYGLFIVPPELADLTTSSWSLDAKETIKIHLIVQMIQMIAIAINAIAFSFCKIGEVSDAEDEELSVEQGGAFASYVDESAGYTPSKPSYSGGDDIEFEF